MMQKSYIILLFFSHRLIRTKEHRKVSRQVYYFFKLIIKPTCEKRKTPVMQISYIHILLWRTLCVCRDVECILYSAVQYSAVPPSVTSKSREYTCQSTVAGRCIVSRTQSRITIYYSIQTHQSSRQTHTLHSNTVNSVRSPVSPLSPLLKAEMTQLLEGYYKATGHFYRILKVGQFWISFSFNESLYLD